MAIVAVAGPPANLALALVILPIYKFTLGSVAPDVSIVLERMMEINLLLFSFNLIPIPPLDGFNILVGILPNPWTLILEPLRRYSIGILLGVVFLVPYLGRSLGIDLNPIGEIIGPVSTFLTRLLLG